MQSPPQGLRDRSARLRGPYAILALAFSLAACGGGSSTSSDGSAVQATATPASAPAETAAASGESQHHRHHRHHHRSGETASPDAGGGGDSADSGTPGSVVAQSGQAAPSAGSWPCDDAAFLKDQQQFATGALQSDQEVDVCGNVTRVLPSRTTRSGLHGYFVIQVGPSATIEIVSDLGEMDAPAWPWVKVGDYSYVQGRYYYDSAASQGIDWTHHGTSRSWPSAGYVVVGSTEYQ